jgi:hypothetical protein
MVGNRKLAAYGIAIVAVLLAGLASTLEHPLPEKGLEVVCYAIGMIFGLYMGGNVGEHWSKRGRIPKDE